MEFTRKGAVASILTLLSLTLLAGCKGGSNASPSNWYPTSSIYAYMKAVQNESGNVTTTVQLRDGPTSTAAYLYLSGGETLYSSLDVSPQQYINFNNNLFGNSLDLSQHLKVMSSRDLYTDYFLFTQVAWGKPEYFSLNTPSPSSSTPTRAYVGFERTGNVMTGDSSVELPPVFQILAPASDAIISRATPLTLTWAGADPASTMELDVAGICVDSSQYTLHLIFADTGSATLNGANYFPVTGISPSISCRVAFLLQRVRLGGVSAQFAFGSFKGVQQRTVQFTSNP